MQKIIVDINDYSDSIESLAKNLGVGDCVLLNGELGVGKTTFARLLIRRLLGDEDLQVASPSFSLLHIYDGNPPIYHFDLYRLRTAEELWELGFEEALSQGITLVEWPEILGDRTPPHCYRIHLLELADGNRRLSLTRD